MPSKATRLLRAGLLQAVLAFAMLGAADAQPTFTKVFAPNTIGPGSVSTLTFTIDNSGSGTPATSLAFTDNLPAGVVIATPANASTDCVGPRGGALSAPDGGTAISLSDGSVAGGGICTVVVDVTSSTPGTHTNVSGDLTSTAGNSGTATADLVVATDRPGFTKSFSPDPVSLGARSTLTFTIDNTANPSLASNLTFTDNLPTGLVVAGPANASTTCTGGVLTANPGTNVISYSPAFFGDASVAAGASCTVSVDVTATGAGVLGNTTDELTSFEGLSTRSSGKASATLEVTAATVAFTKTFTDDPVPPGGTVTLAFSLTNLDRTNTATNLAFTDDLDATLSGLAATGLPANDVCGAGSQISGTSLLSFTGGTLQPGETCTFSVTLQVPAGAATGAYPNTTSNLAADAGVVAAPATDDLFVQPVPLLTKTFLDDPVGAGGTVTLEFTVTNTSPTSSATDITFFDTLTDFLAGATPVGLPMPACNGTLVQLSNFPSTGDLSLFLGSGGGAQPGSLGPGASCNFTVTLQLPVGVSANTYTNTTSEIDATVDAQTFTGNPATDDLQVVGAPTLEKAFTDDPVLPGETVTLEFTLTHDGGDELPPGDATGISFTDDLDAVLSGLVATGLPLNNVCGAGSQISGTSVLSFTGGTLAPGASCTFSITLQVPANAPAGSHTNTTSEVTATVVGVPTTESPATDDLDIAALTLSKAFIDDPVIPGGTVTLRFTIDNVSATQDATDIFFRDDLDAVLSGLVATGLPANDVCGTGSSITGLAGNTLLNFQGGSLLVGESCTFDVTLQVPAGAASDTYGNTTNAFSATIDGSTVFFDNASDGLVVNASVIAFTKAFTDDPVAPGGTVTLEFTLTNEGTSPVTALTFTDDLDAALSGLAAVGLPAMDVCGTGSEIDGTSLLTLTGGNLAAGDFCTFSVTLQVPASVPLGTQVTNTTSSVTGMLGGLAITGAPASDDLTVQSISFTKAFDGSSFAGGMPTLTFTVENLDASNGVSQLGFTDDLDAVLSGLVATGLPAADVCGAGSELSGTSFLTLTEGSLGSGGSCTFDVTLQVPASAEPGSFLNTTSDLFSAGIPLAIPATATLTINPPPTFSKSFDPDSIGVGLTSTLTFTIDNTASTADATGLDFTDNLPAGVTVANPPNATTTCTGGTLTAASGTGVITYTGGTVAAGASCTVSVDVSGDAPGDFVNTSGDLTSSMGNSGTASATLKVVPRVDLELAKSDSPDPVVAGQTVTYTVTLTNNGPSDASTIEVTEALTVPAGVTITSITPSAGSYAPANDPAGIWSINALATGSSETLTIVLAVAASAEAGADVISNTATVTAVTEVEIDDSNDSATETTSVERVSDLSITKTDDDVTARPGAVLLYTLGYENAGPSEAAGVTLTETVPEGTTFYADDGTPGWTCTPDDTPGSTCTLPIGTLAVGAGGQALFAVVVANPLNAGLEAVTNTASIAGEAADLTPADNTATATTPLDAAPAVRATLRDALLVDHDTDGRADPGDTIRYTATVANTGSQGVDRVLYTDTPGAHTRLVCGSVVAAAGTVVRGNTCQGDPDTAVEVRLSEVDGEPLKQQATSTITYDVLVDRPFPARVETVRTQGRVTYADPEALDGMAAVRTDDPDTFVRGDATDTPIDRVADIALGKTASTATPAVGSAVVFTIAVSNEGPAAPSTVTVREALPAGLVYTGHTASVGSYDPATGLWSDVSVDLGAPATLTLTARVATAEPVENVAEVIEAAVADPDSVPDDGQGDDYAAVVLTPVGAPEADLSLAKTASVATVEVEQEFVYRLTLSNAGPDAAEGVVVEDVLPGQVVLVGSTASQGSYEAGTGQWTVGAVPAGAEATLELEVRAEQAGLIENVAEVVASAVADPDSVPGGGAEGEDDRSSAEVEATEVPTSVEGPEEEVPVRYELGVNYPNPFQGETVIPFGVPEGVKVRLAVYDVLGREVAVVVDGVVAAGRHAAVFRAEGLPTGLYVVRMQAGAVVKTRRITFVK